ncbi:MAG TPA: alpha/beta hydrolase [Solirubrobacteraceae bacterium]
MHPDLERWKAKGEYFDYLGFDVFFVKEGAGPNLLLVHGYPFNSYDWSGIWTELTSHFTVIAPDMLGMGFSEKPAAYEYSVHDHADMHEALLRKLGVSACHVLCHDVGVSVVQEMLARHEEQSSSVPPHDSLGIDSITYLNGGLFYEAYTPRLAQTLASRTPLGGVLAGLRRTSVSRKLTTRTIAEMFGPHTKPSPELFVKFHEILEYNDGKRVLHKVGRFMLDRERHRNRWVQAMRNTSVPMRLINGPYDPNSGQHMADRYLELIPAPDVILLDPTIGHWPQIEAPEAVVEHFREHASRGARSLPTVGDAGTPT